MQIKWNQESRVKNQEPEKDGDGLMSFQCDLS